MAQTTITVELGRQQVEEMSAELFVALGPGIWDPYTDKMTWRMPQAQLTYLLLQWPELQGLRNDFIQTIPTDSRRGS